MAYFVANISYNIRIIPLDLHHYSNSKYFSFRSSQTVNHRHSLFSYTNRACSRVDYRRNKQKWGSIVCSASNKPSSPPPDISSTARIRSEVLSPFRTLRMFFYLAFIASAGLGGLIATTQLIAALTNPARAAEIPETLKGLGIDIGAVSIFGFLYYRDNTAEKAQVARLSREENLSNLKLRVVDEKVIPISSLRGFARLVICAGPGSYILESFRLSEPFTQSLLDRGVLVVPFATDGNLPKFEFDESEEMKEITARRKRLWQLNPVIVSDWSKWLDEQKNMAGVSVESPVYLSLRLDGRVRGSGVGYPPWNAFVAQLPQVKGMWSGLLDGMDGRV
ncbi:protein LOW PSII ACCUMULATION 1, chloroplastic [Mercurialis annua]|uniref:protein LOW PSII ACCUMULATION 1, chloroplastic n=1 Tax=Mercurialis annua TaxID=3986 RepID=UPI0021605213|nr:protein LOW PSII ACCUMULATION 1, chloroplastic [Mercurialis annua]